MFIENSGIVNINGIILIYPDYWIVTEVLSTIHDTVLGIY